MWSGGFLARIGGAIIGAIATGLVRERQDRKARDRERGGLLYLLDGEIYYNETLLKQLKQNHSLIVWSSISALRSESWDDSKVRLAQLVEPDHTKLLNAYYTKVKTIVKAINNPRMNDQNKVAAVLAGIDTTAKDGRLARRFGRRYLKDQDFVEAVPEPQRRPSSTGHSVEVRLTLDISRQQLLARLRSPKSEDSTYATRPTTDFQHKMLPALTLGGVAFGRRLPA